MAETPMELLKGTLDVLILKTVSWEPMHGYGVSRAIRLATADGFHVEEGALYPALRRLEKRGLLASRWAKSETGREAKYYRLTREGERRLATEVEHWARYVDTMALVLKRTGPMAHQAGGA